MRYFVFFYFFLLGVLGFSQSVYRYTLDLTNVVGDKVNVTLIPPKVSDEVAILNFPKVIPGTYSIKNYGRFIEDLVALDGEGNKLKVKRKKTNSFYIYKAQNLEKITYLVNDTWDDEGKNFIFQPGGSNIEDGENFAVNNHAFFGYFEGNKDSEFDIKIKKPAGFYASTYLPFEEGNDMDSYNVKGYNFLVDNPILYCRPDTVSFYEGSTKVVISVYSETGNIRSERIAEYIRPISAALAKFWGGDLPIDKYCFLFYFADPEKRKEHKTSGLGGYGALEHNRSSFYYLPEIELESRFKEMIFGVCAHEFLHIITPLNLHSEEIGDFDFINPKMSKHLWLYEGMTEYFSHLVQLEDSLIDEQAFMKEMRYKMNEATTYTRGISFTEMSEHILTKKNQKEYTNVYSKGAILAFLLDLEIMRTTDKRLIDVARTLVNRYGANKSFKDDNLMNEIVQLTSPEIKAFLDNYIVKGKMLPYAQILKSIGWYYRPIKRQAAPYFGSFGVNYEDSSFVIKQPSADCRFPIIEGDKLLKIGGEELTVDNFDDLFDKYFKFNQDMGSLDLQIIRGGEKRTFRSTPLKGHLEQKNYLKTVEDFSEEQRAFREEFFGIN